MSAGRTDPQLSWVRKCQGTALFLPNKKAKRMSSCRLLFYRGTSAIQGVLNKLVDKNDEIFKQ